MTVNDKSRVAVLCCEGIYQRYLVSRLADAFQLVGVVKHVVPNEKGTLLQRLSRYRNPVRLAKYLQARQWMKESDRRMAPLLRRLFYIHDEPPTIPKDISTLEVDNINNPIAAEFVSKLNPDVVCVNGTNLLREPMLALIPSIRLGVINMHTGLSPYSRGGNCNLFMLLEGHPELVGVTIHYIDPGVDSGAIILSGRPEMIPEDTFEEIDAKAFRLGIDLMIIAIQQLQTGRAERVKQWEKGKLFLKKTGYVYNPYLRVQVNRLLKRGLIQDYLDHKSERDAAVRLVGRPE